MYVNSARAFLVPLPASLYPGPQLTLGICKVTTPIRRRVVMLKEQLKSRAYVKDTNGQFELAFSTSDFFFNRSLKLKPFLRDTYDTLASDSGFICVKVEIYLTSPESSISRLYLYQNSSKSIQQFRRGSVTNKQTHFCMYIILIS